MAKTADRLIEGVKRRITMPSNQALLQNADILAMADDVVESRLVPIFLAAREDFFVISDTVSLVNGTSSYDIPYRAIGRALRDLKMINPALVRRDLNKIALEDEHYYSVASVPHSFYFKADKLVLVPPVGVDGYVLERWYNLMPSKLLALSDVSTVTSVVGTTVNVNIVPSALATGVTVDFIQGQSGNTILAMDKAIVGASATSISFASGDIPSALTVGDYIAQAGYSPVIQLPDAAYALLETYTAQRCLNSISDFDGAKSLESDISEELKFLKMVIEPRVQGESTKILNRNSLLNRSRLTRVRRGLYY